MTNFDWSALYKATAAVEPAVWNRIRKQAKPGSTNDAVSFAGYQIFRGILQNYPPRIIIKAELILPETKVRTNPDQVNQLISEAAKKCSKKYSLIVDYNYNYQFRSGALERDRVFGKDPEMPPSIDYLLSLDRTPFIIQP